MDCSFKDLHWSKEFSLKAYYLPGSQEEALDLLERHQGKARIIAGGTDIIPGLRRKDHEVEALVDISNLPDLKDIRERGEEIEMGSLVTHAQASRSPVLREKAHILSDGAGWVGSPQIRNVGTIAGNLVGGQPAGDTSLPLLALNAQVTIVSKAGERRVPLTRFFLSPGKTVLDPTREILTRIHFQSLDKTQGCCYQRLAKRKVLTLPILAVAVVVRVDSDQRKVAEAAIALGPVAPTPFRAAGGEGLLRGAAITPENFRAAAEKAMEEATPRDSCLRGSCDYRREMVGVLVRRGLKKAVEETGILV
jgi:aerobic carbon-monoxide dehydrogenase medium subunit